MWSLPTSDIFGAWATREDHSRAARPVTHEADDIDRTIHRLGATSRDQIPVQSNAGVPRLPSDACCRGGAENTGHLQQHPWAQLQSGTQYVSNRSKC